RAAARRQRAVLRRRERLGLRHERRYPAVRPGPRAGLVRVERRSGHVLLRRPGRGAHRRAADPAGDDLTPTPGRVPGLRDLRLPGHRRLTGPHRLTVLSDRAGPDRPEAGLADRCWLTGPCWSSQLAVAWPACGGLAVSGWRPWR